jgi:hypothetical protein
MHELCKVRVYPSQEEIDRLAGNDKLTVCDLFFHNDYGLYSKFSKSLHFEDKTIDDISGILVRRLKQSQIEALGIRFLIAAKDLSPEN